MKLVFLIVLFTIAEGEKDAKIIGGRFARQNEFPFVVALSGDFGAFCGGTLVALNKVITAGHCVAVKTWLGLMTQNIFVVIGGSLKRDISTKADGMQSRHILSIQLHPQYEIKLVGSAYHDIAALILAKPFELSSSLRPIKWVARNKNAFDEAWKRHLRTGNYCTGVGWGYTKMEGKKPTTLSPDLKAIDLKPQSADYCSLYGRSRGDRDMSSKGEVCLTNLADGQGVCQGDSGSPLICDGYVFGILNAVINQCALVRWPNVYLLLGPYMDLYGLGSPHSSSVLLSTFGWKCFLFSLLHFDVTSINKIF